MARRVRNVNADLNGARFWVLGEGPDLWIEEADTRPAATLALSGHRRVVMGGKRTREQANELLEYLAKGAGYRVRASK